MHLTSRLPVSCLNYNAHQNLKTAHISTVDSQQV